MRQAIGCRGAKAVVGVAGGAKSCSWSLGGRPGSLLLAAWDMMRNGAPGAGEGASRRCRGSDVWPQRWGLELAASSNGAGE